MPPALPDAAQLAAFVAASTVLAVTPGPGVLFIVGRTLASGRRAGLASVAGVAAGNFGNAVGASLGLAALLALSPTAWWLLKLAGAAYLLWLGVQALRAPAADAAGVAAAAAAGAAPDAGALRAMARDGALVALLNPKTALFFAAFLPQFMPAQANVALLGPAFGAAFVLIAALTDSAWALAAAAAAPWLAARRGSRGLGRWLSGTVFIGLGLYAALSGTQRAR